MVIFLGALLLLSGVFSSSETAFTSLNEVRVQKDLNKGCRAAERTKFLISKKEELLSTILVGNNIVNILASSLITMIFTDLFGDSGVIHGTIVMTALVLVFGEITPKTLALTFPEAVSYRFSRFMCIVMKLLTPVTFLINKVLLPFVYRIFKISAAEKSIFSREEFISYAEIGKKEGVLDETETDMLSGVINFRNTLVKDVLNTHHNDIIGFDISSKSDYVREIIEDTKFSRYPIYDGNNIVGILHIKDIAFKDSFIVQEVMIPREEMLFVSGDMTIYQVFLEMKKHSKLLSVVCDKFGETLGIITLEDIIEVIFGDIQDEFENIHPKYVFMRNG